MSRFYFCGCSRFISCFAPRHPSHYSFFPCLFLLRYSSEAKSRTREIKRFREFFGVFCKFFRLFCEKVGIIANIDKILKNFVKYIAFLSNICYNNRKDFIGRLHTYFYVPTVLSSCMFILKGVFTRNEKRFERKSDCFGIH